MIDDMQKLAAKKGGTCLSSTYINDRTKLKWQCSKEHTWEAKPSSVKYKTWCPYCARNVKLSIQDMHKLAAEKGGKCLSDIYTAAFVKLEWQCASGHVWQATPAHVQQGCWCPNCAGVQKKTIKDMHVLAAKKNGTCLSTEYINTGTKLKWQCSKGHIWEAVPNNIRRGVWCPYCSGRKK